LAKRRMAARNLIADAEQGWNMAKTQFEIELLGG
jgi:hypothetical protein